MAAGSAAERAETGGIQKARFRGREVVLTFSMQASAHHLQHPWSLTTRILGGKYTALHFTPIVASFQAMPWALLATYALVMLLRQLDRGHASARFMCWV